MLRDLRWLSAENLITYHRIYSVRRMVISEHPRALADALVRATNHGHDTRHADRFRLPRIHTEAGRRQLMYSGVDAFNNFSAARDTSVHFQTALRNHLLQLQNGSAV